MSSVYRAVENSQPRLSSPAKSNPNPHPEPSSLPLKSLRTPPRGPSLSSSRAFKASRPSKVSEASKAMRLKVLRTSRPTGREDTHPASGSDVYVPVKVVGRGSEAMRTLGFPAVRAVVDSAADEVKRGLKFRLDGVSSLSVYAGSTQVVFRERVHVVAILACFKTPTDCEIMAIPSVHADVTRVYDPHNNLQNSNKPTSKSSHPQASAPSPTPPTPHDILSAVSSSGPVTLSLRIVHRLRSFVPNAIKSSKEMTSLLLLDCKMGASVLESQDEGGTYEDMKHLNEILRNAQSKEDIKLDVTAVGIRVGEGAYRSRFRIGNKSILSRSGSTNSLRTILRRRQKLREIHLNIPTHPAHTPTKKGNRKPSQSLSSKPHPRGQDPESTVALPQDENRGVSATVRRSGPPCDQKRGQDSSGEGGGWLGLLRFELSGYAVRKIRKSKARYRSKGPLGNSLERDF